MATRKHRFLVSMWHWPSIPLKYYHYCWRCLYCLMQGSWHLVLLLYGKPVGLTPVPGCGLMLLLQKSWSVRVTLCTLVTRSCTSWSSNSLFRISPVKSRFWIRQIKQRGGMGKGDGCFISCFTGCLKVCGNQIIHFSMTVRNMGRCPDTISWLPVTLPVSF